DGTARIEYRQPATEKMSEAQRLSEQASQKAKSDDFPQALHLFTQALAANPALPVTRRDLAMLHYELGDLSAGYQPAPAGMYSAFQRFSSCRMHSGFKCIAIERGSGMNLNDPWVTALELLDAGKCQ
ncbi:hypothetical protein EBU02_14610, partial [bacterium]|nr:hypothetical protein [bacterium]